MVERTPEEQGEHNKRIGRIAEKLFSLWCTKGHLTANGATEDEEGWDFFVQKKSSNVPRAFLDLERPTFSALVQVKATESPSGRFRLSLANALKLARNAGPAFVFVAYVEEDDVRAAWLIHCEREFIARVLEAAATHDDGRPLNRPELGFVPVDADRVEPAALVGRLEADIGPDMFKYLERKNELLQTVGYEDGQRVVKLRRVVASAEAGRVELAEFAVGLRHELRYEHADIYDVRFGHTRLVGRDVAPTLTLSSVPSGPEIQVLLETQHESVQLSCSSHVATAVFPFLPESHNKLRLAAPFIDFIVSRDPTMPDVQLLRWSTRDLGTTVEAGSVPDRARAAKVVRLLQVPDARVTLRAPGVPDLVTSIGGEWSVQGEGEQFIRALEDLHVVMEAFGLALTESFSPEHVARCADILGMLACIATHAHTTAKTRFPRTEAPSDLHEGDQAGFLFFQVLPFPSKALIVVSAIVGTVEVDDDAEWLRTRTNRLPRLVHRVVSKPTNEVVQDLLDEAGEVLRGQGLHKVYSPPLE